MSKERITRINDNMRIKHIKSNYEIQRLVKVEIMEDGKKTGEFKDTWKFVGYCGNNAEILNSIILKDMLLNESPEEYEKWLVYIGELTKACENFINIERIIK